MATVHTSAKLTKIRRLCFNLRVAIFGDQRIKAFREKEVNEAQVSKTVFSHLNFHPQRTSLLEMSGKE